jgi:hypothetical protein
LYAGLYVQRFQVRAAQGHKDKSNDDIIDFLPIRSGGEFRIAKPKGSTQRNGRITLLRHLISSLDTHEILLDENSREGVLWHIQDIVASNGLENYFEMMAGASIDDYVEDIRCKANDLVQQGFDALVDDDSQVTQRDTMAYIARWLWHENEE